MKFLFHACSINKRFINKYFLCQAFAKAWHILRAPESCARKSPKGQTIKIQRFFNV